jgi:hypothetical protein
MGTNISDKHDAFVFRIEVACTLKMESKVFKTLELHTPVGGRPPTGLMIPDAV